MGAKDPDIQGIQDVLPAAPEKYPPVQLVQVVDPIAEEKDPTKQLVQALADGIPIPVENVPATQSTHTDAANRLYSPAKQKVHVD
jgi:hypothetical protein